MWKGHDTEERERNREEERENGVHAHAGTCKHPFSRTHTDAHANQPYPSKETKDCSVLSTPKPPFTDRATFIQSRYMNQISSDLKVLFSMHKRF